MSCQVNLLTVTCIDHPPQLSTVLISSSFCLSRGLTTDWELIYPALVLVKSYCLPSALKVFFLNIKLIISTLRWKKILLLPSAKDFCFVHLNTKIHRVDSKATNGIKMKAERQITRSERCKKVGFKSIVLFFHSYSAAK